MVSNLGFGHEKSGAWLASGADRLIELIVCLFSSFQNS
jgi:hypothetical protein